MLRRFVLSCVLVHLCLLLQSLLLQANLAHAEAVHERVFAEFSVKLPDTWDGNERAGFVSRDPKEYMLTLGRKDPDEERYLAFISLYLLPNKPGKDSQASAQTLAEQQAEASTPVQEGPYWVFTGDPRDTLLKGRAKTFVCANSDALLIVIAKDPQGLGAEEIVKSLTPLSERARALLSYAYTRP